MGDAEPAEPHFEHNPLWRLGTCHATSIRKLNDPVGIEDIEASMVQWLTAHSRLMNTAQDHYPMSGHLNNAVDSQTQHQWNARYEAITSVPQAAYVLWENQHLLPTTGQALDLACGLGGNALLLAACGLETWAWDMSDIAVARVQTEAQQRGVPLHAEVRDVVVCPPCAESFDVIVVSRFLDRALAPALVEALRPSGLLLYQTFTQVTVGDARGPMNPAYRLAPQELLTLFHPLRILVYREEGNVGDTTRGWRNEALLVAQKG